MTVRTPVAIVGGGATGLVTACALLQQGIAVRVLESAPEPPAGSRAILLWPPTLEVLRAVGVLDEAVARGFMTEGMTYHLTGSRPVRVRLAPANRPLLLPQDQTNALLEAALERLGGRVERSVTVTSVVGLEDGVTVKASGPGGSELVEADWLVGADGIRSTVRAALGIDFPGARIPATFLLAEGTLDGEIRRADVHYAFGPHGVFVLAPLPGGIVRVATALPEGAPLTPETVRSLFAERGPKGVQLGEITMITTFSSHERVAAALRQGRAFLVGDAGHTHSPIGGQGLNLGIQDVRNLVWKLAGVIQGRLDPAILDTYEPERRQAVAQTLRLTQRLGQLAGLRGARATGRDLAWNVLQRVGALDRWYAPTLAGWRNRYPDALLPDAELPGGPVPGGVDGRRRRITLPAARLPAAGERTPAWVPAPEPGPTPTRGGAGVLRLLTLGSPDGDLARRAGAVADRWPDLLWHDHEPRRSGGFLLLRPDGYVVTSGDRLADLARVEGWLPRLAGA